MKKPDKVYISGKISGMDLIKAEFIFLFYEEHLKDYDLKIVNPVRIKHDHDKSWEMYMRVDLIHMLKSCGCIYMLPNWKKSRGARIEHYLAKELGLTIVYDAN